MRLRITVDGEAYEVVLAPGPVVVDGHEEQVRVEGNGAFRVHLGGRVHTVLVERGRVVLDGEPMPFEVQALPPAGMDKQHQGGAAGPVHPPMPGRVAEVRVRPGDRVKAGQCLVLLEAMKMQNEVPAPVDGVVREVRVKPGQLVEPKDVLVVIE